MSESNSAAGAPDYPLDLLGDPVALTRDLVDIASPSRAEEAIARAVHEALRRTIAGFAGPGAGTTTLERVGNCVVARTHRGLPSRVVLAGHLDTVPVADNLPAVIVWEADGRGPVGNGPQDTGGGGHPAPQPAGEERMYGCGTSDMKAGDAVFLHLFARLADSPELAHDLSLILYDCEEIEASANGLGVLQRARPELLEGDLAILGEPTDGLIEAGCQGTLRVRVHARGVRAHSARSWLGDNAIHRLAPVFAELATYSPRSVEIDGCLYREGLQAVRASAGVSGNVVPDEASVEVNFRFAPDRSPEDALAHAVAALGLADAPRSDVPLGDDAARDPDDRDELGPGLSWELTDMSPGALPGLSRPAAAALVAAAGGQVRAKYGWTDVSRFAAAGIAAVNLGPGDPGTAHKRDEFCRVAEIGKVAEFLAAYLTSAD